MSGYVIRQLTKEDGQDNLSVAMIIEEGDLGEDRSAQGVIILESSETGRRLWAWAQREGKNFPFSPPAFGQPAGIKATRLKAYTQVAQNLRVARISQDHCIVTINGIGVIVNNEDLFLLGAQ